MNGIRVKAVSTKLDRRGEDHDVETDTELTIKLVKNTSKHLSPYSISVLRSPGWGIEFSKENFLEPGNGRDYWVTKDGWYACGGTRGSWHQLYLSAESMQEIWDEFNYVFNPVCNTDCIRAMEKECTCDNELGYCDQPEMRRTMGDAIDNAMNHQDDEFFNKDQEKPR